MSTKKIHFTEDEADEVLVALVDSRESVMQCLDDSPRLTTLLELAKQLTALTSSEIKVRDALGIMDCPWGSDCVEFVTSETTPSAKQEDGPGSLEVQDELDSLQPTVERLKQLTELRERYPIGTDVRYWRYVGDDGTISKVRSDVWVQDGVPVLLVEGWGAPVPLTKVARVEPVHSSVGWPVV